MAETLTPELTFGRYNAGIGVDGSQIRRTIWITAAYALSLDFKNGLYSVNGAQTSTLSSLTGYNYTRSGAKSEIAASGIPVPFLANVPGIVPNVGYWSRSALTNLLLNAGTSANLGTQTTAALTAAPYTLYFEGTGSVALSGAFVGNLAGTGANNMVALVFTPTAAALTVTVTGNVTYAGLVLGNFPAGGPIIATAGATAGTGADVLVVATETLADVDQTFEFLGSINSIINTVRFFSWSVDGNNVFYVQINGTSVQLVGVVGGSVVANITTAAAVSAVSSLPIAVIVSRNGGATKLALRYNGTTTISAPTTCAISTGVHSVAVGEALAANQINNTVVSLAHKLGASSDADLTARLLALMGS